jgi:hypothetical protein
MVEVRFQLEPKDYEALNAFVHRGTLLGWLVSHMSVVGVIFVLVFAAWVFDWRDLVTSGFFVLLFAGFLVFFWRRRHRGLRSRGEATFATYTLSTSSEGIQTTAPGRSSSVAWSHVQGYGDTREHVFIMLDGVAGQIVTKRCLSAEAAALLAELKERASQLPARPKPASASLWRLAFLWIVLVVVVFLVWYLSGVMIRR